MEIYKKYHERLELAYQDLLHCKNYAEVLLQTPKGMLGEKERVIFSALLTALVVSYGRVFKKSYIYNKDASVKYNVFIKKEREKLSQKEKRDHEFLLSERDGIFAHSDSKSHDLTLHTILGSVGYFGNDVFRGYEASQIKSIIKIVNYFISKISEEKNKIENKYSKTFK